MKRFSKPINAEIEIEKVSYEEIIVADKYRGTSLVRLRKYKDSTNIKEGWYEVEERWYENLSEIKLIPWYEGTLFDQDVINEVKELEDILIKATVAKLMKK